MRISKKTEYGLTAVLYLARNKNNEAVSIREISNAEAVPFEFLSKILAYLEKIKLVTAKRGVKGGYILAKNPKEITVSHVVSSLENIKVANCQICARSRKCLTKDMWNKIDEAVSRTLSSITLADLIK